MAAVEQSFFFLNLFVLSRKY
uniref:Uncharacterized protein n=1 Tax=Arundo donax TaxID=35708 RepID=A0A0A9H5M9_ARUDO